MESGRWNSAAILHPLFSILYPHAAGPEAALRVGHPQQFALCVARLCRPDQPQRAAPRNFVGTRGSAAAGLDDTAALRGKMRTAASAAGRVDCANLPSVSVASRRSCGVPLAHRGARTQRNQPQFLGRKEGRTWTRVGAMNCGGAPAAGPAAADKSAWPAAGPGAGELHARAVLDRKIRLVPPAGTAIVAVVFGPRNLNFGRDSPLKITFLSRSHRG
jgi:hypothetical protein